MSDLPLKDCTCPHGERPLGVLYGVNMGRGTVRLSTTKDCPIHDACQRFTKAHRAGRPSWSDPWCVIHGKKPCPEEEQR